MKNILTVEGFFDKFKNKKKSEPKEEYVEKEKEKITVPDNSYYAQEGNKEGHWFVWKGWGFGGRPIASISKLDDGNFLLVTNNFSDVEARKNIKIPNIKRGLEYMKEVEEERKKNIYKIDIDLT